VCPGHHFVSEEGSGERRFDAEYCWIVDPLDGTTNYVHQVPHYCVSVALAHHGRVVAGAVFDPTSGDCYTAELGGGSRLNGRPIRTSGVSDLSQALVAASFSAYIEFPSREIDQFVQSLVTCQAVRRTGSAALNLCYVASGRFDAFWALSTSAWDIAAGVLLVEEAGGVATLTDGRPLTLDAPYPAASATPLLHEQFCRMLESARRLVD
jgi:myo-inositol-1(or 4)-monophosphatase